MLLLRGICNLFIIDFTSKQGELIAIKWQKMKKYKSEPEFSVLTGYHGNPLIL
jgi:hypothetical protein